MLFLKDLLINLLAIILFVIIFSMLIWNKRGILEEKYFQPLLFAFSSFLIFLSIILSYDVGDNFKYDLRYIPFLIGAMYGGKHVAIGLASILVFFRVLFGGIGVFPTFIIAVLSIIILFKLFPKISYHTTKWRLIFTASMAALYGLITYLIPANYYGFFNFYDMIIFFVLLIGSILFVTYLTEVFRTFYIYQQEIIRNEKTKIISQLAASISHEVKNPLTSVKGFLQLMLEDRSLSREGREYTKLAYDEVSRATEIINDYLNFAKPYHGDLIKLDIKNSIIKCTDIIKPLATSTNVTIHTNFCHHHKINGDPNKLIQILLNICKNSIEAMPNGGELSISTYEKNEFIYVNIIDNGSGISNEHLTRLGEPYFSTKQQDGTGLGLMVVFQLVKGMNGRLKIESEKNIGTSVTLMFPAVEN